MHLKFPDFHCLLTHYRLAILLFLTYIPAQNCAYNLSYTMEEEVPGPLVIADLAHDIRVGRFFSMDELRTKTIAFFPSTQPGRRFFKVRRNSGISQELVLIRKIDRETACSQSSSTTQICRCTNKLCFAVLKFAVLPLSSSNFIYFTARIVVADRNDHFPTFSPASFTVYFSEADLPGTAHQIPRASDPDFGANAALKYSLTAHRDLFTLQDTSDQHVLRLVLRGQLDRESKDHYSFIIVARDMGSPPQAGTLSVTVLVRDDNDSPPIFSHPVYNATLMENSARGTTVVQLRATDKDSGVNQQVHFLFAEDTSESVRSLFRLNPKTGLITVEGDVDREIRDQFRFGVMARDRGTNAKSSNAVVVVRILDLNDHAPELIFAKDEAGIPVAEETGIASVRENRRQGTVVTTFTAKDPDLSENGTVLCRVMDRGEYFEVQRLYADDQPVFKLVTRVRFDREMAVKRTVRIVCADGGRPPQKTQKILTILIADENDNAPKFNNGEYNEYHVNVQENNEVGRMLIRFNATDPDIGPNGKVRYKLINDSSARGFSLSSTTGRLYLNRVLDREDTPGLTLTVLAYDQGSSPLTSTATLQVVILDVNDCAPQLEMHYNLSVLENQEPGTIVDRIIVPDPDSGKNGEVYLFGGDGDNFEVRPSGVVITKRMLDRETLSHYSFVIYARDDGEEVRLTSSATVHVRVLDLNDEAPSFIYPKRDLMNFTISYKEAVGFLIFKLVASDRDTGANGRLSYRLEPESSFFRVDTDNGLVLTASTFSSSDLGEHRLHCVAQDHGRPHSLKTSVEVNIQVVDRPPQGVKNLRRSAPENFIIMIVLGIFAGILICVLAVAIALVLRRKRIDSAGMCFRGHSSYRSDDKDTRSTDSSSTVNINRETVFGVASKPRRQPNGNLYSGSPTHIPLRSGAADGELESMESVHGSHTDSGRGGSVDSTPCPVSTFIAPSCGAGLRGNIDRVSVTGSSMVQSHRRGIQAASTMSSAQLLHPNHVYQPLIHTPSSTLRPACLHINCRGTLQPITHSVPASGTLTWRRKPSSTCPVQHFDLTDSLGAKVVLTNIEGQVQIRDTTLPRRLQQQTSQELQQHQRCSREDHCDGESSSGLSDGPVIQQSAV